MGCEALLDQSKLRCAFLVPPEREPHPAGLLRHWVQFFVQIRDSAWRWARNSQEVIINFPWADFGARIPDTLVGHICCLRPSSLVSAGPLSGKRATAALSYNCALPCTAGGSILLS